MSFSTSSASSGFSPPPITVNATINILRRSGSGLGSSYQTLYRNVPVRVYPAKSTSVDIHRERFGTEVVYTILAAIDTDLLSNDQVSGYNPFKLAEEPLYFVRLVVVRGDGPLVHREGLMYQIGRGVGQ